MFRANAHGSPRLFGSAATVEISSEISVEITGDINESVSRQQHLDEWRKIC